MEFEDNNVIHFRSEIGGQPVVCTVTPHTLAAKASLNVTERHSHSFFELLYIEKGNGLLVTDETSIAYSNHFVCLIAPNRYHTRDPQGTEEFLSIKFVPDSERTEPVHIQKEVSAAFSYLNDLGIFAVNNHTRLNQMFAALVGELREPKPSQAMVLGGFMSGILAVLLQELLIMRGGQKPAAKSPIEESSLAHRAAVIDCFFDQMENANATMEDLCWLVHVSPGQLNRIVKAQYGRTFKQKLIDMRIEYIKHLLEHTEYNIPEITALMNFSSEGNLSQFFKKHCGISPTAYRQKKRRKK